MCVADATCMCIVDAIRSSVILFVVGPQSFSHLARYVHFCFHRTVKQIFRCISEHWANVLVYEFHLMRCISSPCFLLSFSQDPPSKSRILLAEFMTMLHSRLTFFQEEFVPNNEYFKHSRMMPLVWKIISAFGKNDSLEIQTPYTNEFLIIYRSKTRTTETLSFQY